MRVVCLSDTHGKHGSLSVPEGDLLVHAGDFTRKGAMEEVAAFAGWMRSLPHPHKVLVAGNHDFLFQNEPRLARELLDGLTYLQDEGTTVLGLRIWGSPWQPWFFDWAFNLRRGAPLAAKWALIPERTDILVTHGPPRGIGDRVDGTIAKAAGVLMGQGEEVGCDDLLARVLEVRPRLHVFGHIHEGYGLVERDGITYVNASSCDVKYRPVNPPIVVDL